MPPSPLRPGADGVELAVYVQPRAARTRVVGEHDGAIKLQIQAPAVEGAANAALIAFLAKALGVAKGDVEIRAGQRARRKRVWVRGVTVEAAQRALLPGS